MSENITRQQFIDSLVKVGEAMWTNEDEDIMEVVDANAQEVVTFLCAKPSWIEVDKKDIRNSFWNSVFIAIEKTSKRKYISDDRRRLSMSAFLLEQLEKAGITIRRYI